MVFESLLLFLKSGISPQRRSPTASMSGWIPFFFINISTLSPGATSMLAEPMLTANLALEIGTVVKLVRLVVGAHTDVGSFAMVPSLIPQSG